jgi:signal transduction histidine kinase
VAAAGAFARLMLPLAAAFIVGVRSPDRLSEEVRMKAWVHSMRSALRGLLRGPDFDVVLAFIAFAALLIDPLVAHQVKELTPLAAALALVTAMPLVLRRRYPLGVLVTVVPLLLVCLAVFHPDRTAAAVVMLVVFTVGLNGHRSRSLVVGALMAPVVAAGVLITSHRLGGDSVTETVAYLALVLGALAAGDAVRARQALVRVLAQEEERERAALAQHRFDEQRLRYAHELHDVVGHALVAINVRASAAAHLARREQPVSPVAALEEIASTSAEALGELRAALKGLRSDESNAPLRPPGAGLADLDDLIAGVKGAGLAVELEMAAAPVAVPPTIAHAGYRIVQEGLTNVLRHSTAKHAVVRIGRDEGALLVEVLDDGQGKPAISTGGGHGLLGMRERAAALGGTCEAGLMPGGGWRIRARIPIGQEER